MEYTPGPWAVGSSGSTIFALGTMVARTRQLPAGRVGEELANARLIAKAPELVEALRDTVIALEAHIKDDVARHHDEGITVETLCPCWNSTVVKTRALLAELDGDK